MSDDSQPLTDLERFVSLYKDFGIECEVEEVNLSEDSDDEHFVREKHIVLTRDESFSERKLEGYSGFYTIIKFDWEGNFITQGFWE